MKLFFAFIKMQVCHVRMQAEIISAFGKTEIVLKKNKKNVNSLFYHDILEHLSLGLSGFRETAVIILLIRCVCVCVIECESEEVEGAYCSL